MRAPARSDLLLPGERRCGVARSTRRGRFAVALTLLCAGCAAGPAGRRDPAEFWRTFARERGGVAPQRQLVSLGERLKDKDPAVRRKAAAEAGTLGAGAAPLVPTLIQRLEDEEDAWALSDTAVALARILPPVQASARAYRYLLDSENRTERLWAMLRLPHVRHVKVLRVGDFAKGLSDPDPAMRRRWHSLSYGPVTATGQWVYRPDDVAAGLRDPRPEVRELAVRRIPAAKLDAHAEQLITALNDPWRRVRLDAEWKLKGLLVHPIPLFAAYGGSFFDEPFSGVDGGGSYRAQTLVAAEREALREYWKGETSERRISLPMRLVPIDPVEALFRSDTAGSLILPALIQSATFGAPDVRRCAIYGIGESGPNAALPALRKILLNSAVKDRLACISALRQVARTSNRAIPLLKSALRDKDGRVRVKAAAVLAEVDAVNSCDDIVTTLLGSKIEYDADVMFDALVELGNLGPLARDMTGFLLDYPKANPQIELKVWCPRDLRSIAQGGVPFLMARARKGDGPAARALLPTRPVSRCVWVFFSEELLKRPDKRLAIECVARLAEDVPKRFVKKETIETARDLLTHSDELTRISACQTLIALEPDDDRALRQLIALAPDAEDRERIMYALLDLVMARPTDTKVIAAFVQTLRRSLSPYDVGEALRGLALMGSEAAAVAPPLIAWLRAERDARLKRHIIDVLARVAPRDPAVIAALAAHLRTDKSPPIRAGAARGLAACGAAARVSIDDLVAAAREKPSFVSRAAILALGRVAWRTDKPVVHLLVEKLINDSEQDYIRRAAYDALNMLTAAEDER